MAEPIVEIGKQTVIATGSIVLSRQETSFTIRLADIRLEFFFVDEKGGSQSLSAEVAGEKTLRVKLFNFKNVLGTAWKSQVGRADGKPLHCALYVTGLEGGSGPGASRFIAYTLTKGEANDEG